MNLTEAAELAKANKVPLAEWTISKYARNGAFFATQPNGRTGGWDIEEKSFVLWLKLRRKSGANNPMAKAMDRGWVE
jgi:hypothetical protein